MAESSDVNAVPDEPEIRRCRASSETSRCDFHGTREELSAHADEVRHPRCIVPCGRDEHGEARLCAVTLAWHERQCCTRCVARVRDDLDAVVVAHARLEQRILDGAYRTAWLPALTMAGDGAMAGGGEDDHVRYRDPWVVVAVLEEADRDWREEFGHPRPAYKPLGHPDRAPGEVLAECLAYLRAQHLLAARTHPGFDAYAGVVRDLRSKVEHMAGLADDPLAAPARCFDCGGRLLRTYRAPERVARLRLGRKGEGLTDDWTCRGCGLVYNQEQYFLALRARRDECAGWVSPRLAADVLRCSEQTVWWWQQRMDVTSACSLATRRILIDWAEVAERAAQLAARRNRKAS